MLNINTSMYSWSVTVNPGSKDLFLYPSPGKLRTVRYQLLYAGFTVWDVQDAYYELLAEHQNEYTMTLFSLRYGSIFDLRILSRDK